MYSSELITCGHPRLAGRPMVVCRPIYCYLVLSFGPIGALEDNDTSRSERYFLYSEITFFGARSDYRWAPKPCQPTNFSGVFVASHNNTPAHAALNFGSARRVRRSGATATRTSPQSLRRPGTEVKLGVPRLPKRSSPIV